jgi:hypothetical protein
LAEDGVIRLVAAGLLAVVFLHPAQARANLVIKGEAAEALKCATVILASLVVLQRMDLVTPAEVSLGKAVADLMMERVPGTARQKQQAIQIMGRRLMENKTPEQILTTFQQALPRCERQFS